MQEGILKQSHLCINLCQSQFCNDMKEIATTETELADPTNFDHSYALMIFIDHLEYKFLWSIYFMEYKLS